MLKEKRSLRQQDCSKFAIAERPLATTAIYHFTRSEQESAQEVVAYALDDILLEPTQHSQFLAMESSVMLPLSPLPPSVRDIWSRLTINDKSGALPSLRSFNEGTKGRVIRLGRPFLSGEHISNVDDTAILDRRSCVTW